MTIKVKSNWTGSKNTSDLVRKQIAKRWGKKAAEDYNPLENCFTFKHWLENGYKVRRGETSLKSFIVIEQKDKKSGKVVNRHLKTICLFYKTQVDPQA